MLRLEKNVFDGIIDLLLPYAESEASRRAMLIPYLLNHQDLLKQIDWSGAPHTFSVELVKRLWQHGEIEEGQQGLVMLLQALNPLVGAADQSRIAELIETINQAEEMPEGTGHWPDEEPASRGGVSTTTIDTEGGAFIGGNVSVGGNFTGRDSVTHNRTIQGDEVHGDKVAGDKFTGDKVAGDKKVVQGDEVAGNKNVVNGTQNVVDGTQNIVQGDQISGNQVGGNLVTGNNVEGDSINVGNISGGTGIAIGRGAQSTVTTSVSESDEVKALFASLLELVREQNSDAFSDAMALREEMRRSDPDDKKAAKLIETIAEQVPGITFHIVSMFGSSPLNELAGPITQFVLERFE